MKTKLFAFLLTTAFALLGHAGPKPDPEPKLFCLTDVRIVTWGVFIHCKLYDFCKTHLSATPPKPSGTNAPPCTNSTARASFELDDSAVQLNDISACHYAGPDGLEYHTLATFTLPPTSANLQDWQVLTITNYVSATFILSVSGTNVSLQPYSDRWTISAGLPDNEPSRFFRSAILL